MTFFSGNTLTLLLTSALFTLAGCGGSSSDSGDSSGSSGGGNSGTPQWVAGVFAPDSELAGQCAANQTGSELTEKLWLRSWSNDTYLWYNEIADIDPAPFGVLPYFDKLKTQELSATGNTKDQFHFSMPTSEWDQLNQSGASVGYGAHFYIQQAEGALDRKITVTYVEPDSPASDVEITRGYVVTEIDGVNVKDAADSASLAILSRGLFPETAGQQTQFTFQHLDKTTFSDMTLTAQTIVSTPVQNTTTIVTTTGKVGYLQFNSHIATAERGLFDAVNTLSDAGVDDLVLDLRYNGGGLLAMAGQLGYMIAGNQATQGKIFERSTFNDKHPDTDPVTGQALTPMPFFSESLGFNTGLLGAGQSLPSLNLSRLFVLTTANTCSASEALMNSLRGIDVEVIQIGDTTCGKPYGFYPTPNCGTTFFTVQFKGENEKGFGDYSDGFVPSTSPTLDSEIPGCSLSDDFSHALGDTSERLLSAALYYRANGRCPTIGSRVAKAKPRTQIIDPGFTLEDTRTQNVLLNNRILTQSSQ